MNDFITSKVIAVLCSLISIVPIDKLWCKTRSIVYPAAAKMHKNFIRLRDVIMRSLVLLCCRCRLLHQIAFECMNEWGWEQCWCKRCLMVTRVNNMKKICNSSHWTSQQFCAKCELSCWSFNVSHLHSSAQVWNMMKPMCRTAIDVNVERTRKPHLARKILLIFFLSTFHYYICNLLRFITALLWLRYSLNSFIHSAYLLSFLQEFFNRCGIIQLLQHYSIHWS